jgi:hypothetical protein
MTSGDDLPNVNIAALGEFFFSTRTCNDKRNGKPIERYASLPLTKKLLPRIKVSYKLGQTVRI